MITIQNNQRGHQRHRVGTILVFTLCLMLATLMKAQTSQSSGTGYNVVFQIMDFESSPTWPIAVKELRVGEKDISPGKPIHLEGNWLSQVHVVVQNTSVKQIVHAQMQFSYPESGKGTNDSPQTLSVASVGRLPDIARIRRDGSRVNIPPENEAASISIHPGDLFTFTFTGTEDPDDLALASGKAGSPISKVEIRFSLVYFDDNTKWSAGTYWAPTADPTHWARLAPDAFLQKH